MGRGKRLIGFVRLKCRSSRIRSRCRMTALRSDGRQNSDWIESDLDLDLDWEMKMDGK